MGVMDVGRSMSSRSDSFKLSCHVRSVPSLVAHICVCRSDEGRVSGEVDIPLSGMVVVRWANKGATLLSRGVKCSVELLPPLTKDMDATKDLGAADANAVAVSHEQ